MLSVFQVLGTVIQISRVMKEEVEFEMDTPEQCQRYGGYC
jgi:hypothetical protein